MHSSRQFAVGRTITDQSTKLVETTQNFNLTTQQPEQKNKTTTKLNIWLA